MCGTCDAYHGIRYFSTHYSEYPDNPKTYMNYVFPPRTILPSGHCPELCGYFELTEPVTWEYAKSLRDIGFPRLRYTRHEVPIDSLENEFGRAEDGLFTLPVDFIGS